MSTVRSVVRSVVFAALAGSVVVAAQPALAQTTLTMSSWVSPTHHITAVVLQGWANEAEKVTNGRVKFQMLPKHPSAPRSEEHTSELQSRGHLVCRLLLEKKK